MAVSAARAAAFDILLRLEREASYASELLHSGNYRRLSTADHALATELVMGVLRWRSRLDDQIATASSQPLAKLDLEVLIALRLALYQFGWLDRIPPHAALHESVELMKGARKRSAAPFVNAVLRKLAARAPNWFKPSDIERYTSADALARALAHPLWLVERWVGHYGLDVAQKICRHNQTIPTTAIRLRVPSAEAELLTAGIDLAPGSLLNSARRVNAGDVTKTAAFRRGRAAIQDEASQLVATLVSIEGKSGKGRARRILDCCAAPGGKTLAIADRNPDASIVATELHLHRARLLKELTRTIDSPCPIHIIVTDARQLPFSISFDRVLADVPCSGTGTLARNPEIKWRLSPGDLHDLQARQLAILASALAQVAPKGRLIYSTCSLEKEENEDVVEQTVASNKSFSVLDCRAELERLKTRGEFRWSDIASLTRGPYLRTIPGIHACDGFFAAILEKT